MNAEAANHSTVQDAPVRPFKPGHLLKPFGWVAQTLAPIIQSSPQLVRRALELDRTRMHLIALALAHLDDADPDITRVLFCAPTQEVLHRILGRCPPGTKRILDRLPPTVLSQQGYQNLVSLLDDPRSARLLHHLDQTEITDSTVRVLYEVPTALRPILMRLVPFVSRLDHVPDGLRWLVARGAAANLDHLVADLARHTQPTQFIARLKRLVEELPLPQTLPPLQIGVARRIDATADLCALARSFGNCLATYTSQVDDGSCAIYFWDDATEPAVSHIARHGRFGWSHVTTLGPRNTELPSDCLQRIIATFADAGIAKFATTRALEIILQSNPKSRARTRQRQNGHDHICDLAQLIEDEAE